MNDFTAEERHLLVHALNMEGWLGATYMGMHAEERDSLIARGLFRERYDGNIQQFELTDTGRAAAEALQ